MIFYALTSAGSRGGCFNQSLRGEGSTAPEGPSSWFKHILFQLGKIQIQVYKSLIAIIA